MGCERSFCSNFRLTWRVSFLSKERAFFMSKDILGKNGISTCNEARHTLQDICVISEVDVQIKKEICK